MSNLLKKILNYVIIGHRSILTPKLKFKVEGSAFEEVFDLPRLMARFFFFVFI